LVKIHPRVIVKETTRQRRKIKKTLQVFPPIPPKNFLKPNTRVQKGLKQAGKKHGGPNIPKPPQRKWALKIGKNLKG